MEAEAVETHGNCQRGDTEAGTEKGRNATTSLSFQPLNPGRSQGAEGKQPSGVSLPGHRAEQNSGENESEWVGRQTEKNQHTYLLLLLPELQTHQRKSLLPYLDEHDMASAVASERELPLKPHSFWEKGAITTDLSCQTEMATHGCGQKSNF